MSVELSALFVFCAAFALLILVQAMVLAKTNGLGYVMGNRSDAAVSPKSLSGRLDRTVGNTLEAAALFIPLVLISSQTGISNSLTQWGAIIFVSARIAYNVIYPAGLPVVRTLVWNAGFVALIVMGLGLLTA
jgi:uncharacterized MAPEG superfamily protein